MTPARALLFLLLVSLPAFAEDRPRVFIEAPDLVIEVVGEGPLATGEQTEISEKVVSEAAASLESLGYAVVADPAQAQSRLVIRYRGFRNSGGRKAANGAAFLGGIATLGICAGPAPMKKPESTMRIALVDAADGTLRSGSTATAFVDSAPSMARREVARLPDARRLPRVTPPRRPMEKRDLPAEGSNVVLERVDGRTYIGKMLSATDERLVLESPSGKVIEIPLAELAKISRY